MNVVKSRLWETFLESFYQAINSIVLLDSTLFVETEHKVGLMLKSIHHGRPWGLSNQLDPSKKLHSRRPHGCHRTVPNAYLVVTSASFCSVSEKKKVFA